MLIAFVLAEKSDYDIVKSEFKEKYGVIIEGINIDLGIAYISYYALFFLRRLVYVIILVAFYDSFIWQIFLIITITIIPVNFLLRLDVDLFDTNQAFFSKIN